MDVLKQDVWRDNTSCNFCNKGKLSGSGMSLIYPYEVVFKFIRDSGNGLCAAICKDCLNELYEKVSALEKKI